MKAPFDLWNKQDEQNYQAILLKNALNSQVSLEQEEWYDKAKIRRTRADILCNGEPTARPLEDKLHYRWIEFYIAGMQRASNHAIRDRADNAAWLILLNTELQALRDWKPRLTRPHTLRRHGFLALRAEYVMKADYSKDSDPIELDTDLDRLQFPRSQREWKFLWEEPKNRCAELFPIITDEYLKIFKPEVVRETYLLTFDLYPAFQNHQLDPQE